MTSLITIFYSRSHLQFLQHAKMNNESEKETMLASGIAYCQSICILQAIKNWRQEGLGTRLDVTVLFQGMHPQSK